MEFIIGPAKRPDPLAQPTLRCDSKCQRAINAVDLLGGYVANGKPIETRGHFWLNADRAIFNVDSVSQRVPMSVDLSKLAPQAVQKLRAECSADSEFSAGCEVIFRGAPAPTGHGQILIAQDIQINKT